MGGDERAAAARQVLVEQSGEQRLAIAVECGGGFVEQPQRARRQRETGKSQAAALTRGQSCERQAALPHESGALQRRVECLRRPLPVVQPRLHRQVLARAELILPAARMALIDERAVPGGVAAAAFGTHPQHGALGGRHQAGNDAQQGGLARAVGTSEHRPGPAGHREVEGFEQAAVADRAPERAHLQPGAAHRVAPARTMCRCASTARRCAPLMAPSGRCARPRRGCRRGRSY